MDKVNDLDLQDDVRLEDIFTTAFLQIRDSNQLERSRVTMANATPERNESLEPLPENVEIDKLFNDLQKLALEVAGGISTSSNPQETFPTVCRDLTLPESQRDDMFLLFEHESPTCLNNSGTFSPLLSDASNDVFHTPEPSQDISVEDASECLIAFDVIPETPINGTNDLAIPCPYDQNELTGDILVDFSLVEKNVIPGSKDNSLLDAGLVVSACTSPFRELNSICSNTDESFSPLERQAFSVATSLTPAALADATKSFELSPSFLALLPSPISSKTLFELEDDASWHLPDMMQVVPSALVDNLNKTHRHSTDYREETADDRRPGAPPSLRHTAESPNWAIAPEVAPLAASPRRQNGRRRGRLPEPRDSSQKLLKGFPAPDYRFESIPIFKKCDNGEANSRRNLNQPNSTPKLPITTARSSGSDLHRPNPGPGSTSFNFNLERQTQDEKSDLYWPTGLATGLGRLGHYSTPAVDNDHISVSLVNSNFRAHPGHSASWKGVSKGHPEIEQSTILPHAETNLKKGAVLPPPRIRLIHRAQASSEKAPIFHESSLPPLRRYSGFSRSSFPHMTSTSSPLPSAHGGGVRNQNFELNSLLQDFRPGYEDCPIYGLYSSALDHISPWKNLQSKKQVKAADSLSETKNGVPKRMRSNIPVSVMNKGHRSGSPEKKLDEKDEILVNRNQQLATSTEQSQVLHNFYRTSNLDNVGLPALKASPRVGTEGLSNIGHSSRSTKPDRFAHIHPILRGGRVIGLRAKRDDTKLKLSSHDPDFVDGHKIKTRC
ncbi:hypothetical protein BYT27DRAFT_7239771 [Phlegmacium glaucopus]|nr:hypothetical protein BYT27DRAFT_7239771 [Phlegmacium glaucopus]